jgi:urate oxidase
MKVVRHDTHHEMKEWNVQVLLHGDFETAFTQGDNSKILPTDTMKNTVYWMARESKTTVLEEFATELANYILDNNPQVTKASVEVEEKGWKQLHVNGEKHPTTYSMTGPEVQTTEVTVSRDQHPKVISGVDGLMILKTTKSAFTGYIKDKLTTLPESTDRIFGTRATIAWEYDKKPHSYASTRSNALDILVKTFAEHDSLSVQHTLYDMGEDLLEAIPEIREVTLTMPNLHCLLVDLSRFGQENPNQIFVPIDEPHGYIEAVIER